LLTLAAHSGLGGADLRPMSLGLSHSLSRYKLKFSPEKVDTMIVQVRADVLVRQRATASQGARVSARARLKNVAHVFHVPVAARPAVAGQRVVIVDDVLTTGATVTACSKALLRAGARTVSIVTLARVVRPLSN
ncbi:MAG: ComF family protein, partial [Alphaproteobacteria bacterium]